MRERTVYSTFNFRLSGAWLSNILANDANKMLALLLSVDASFIVIHIRWWTTLVFTGVMGDPNFSITHERGFGEIFQYIKEFWVVLLLLSASVYRRAWVLAAWAVFFGYVLYDDASAFHERWGSRVAAFVPDLAFPGVVSPQDIGELALFCGVALVFIPLLGTTHWLGSPAARRMSRRLMWLVVLLASFGVVADLIHRLHAALWWDLLFGVIEDGGELVVLSIIFWYVFQLFDPREPRATPVPVPA